MPIRIILDTNVIRHIVHDSLPITPDLILSHKPKLLVSISELAWLELAADLYNNTIKFSEWAPKAGMIDKFLHKEMPVMPIATDLLLFAGILKKPPHYDSNKFRANYKSKWKLIKNAKNKQDLEHGWAITTKNSVFIDNGVEKIIQGGRDGWIDQVNACRDAFIRDGETNPDIYEYMKRGYKPPANFSPDATRRLDAYYRFFAIKVKKSMMIPPYKPEANRNRNDGLDWFLLSSLALPTSIICSDDKRFIRNVIETKSWQTKLIVTGKELMGKIHNNQLVQSLCANMAGTLSLC